MGNTREIMRHKVARTAGLFATLVAAFAAQPSPAAAQWSRTYEQFYMPGDFNWTFRRTYPGADRLFNAFDYGHAILYEKLYTRPGDDVSVLEDQEYNFITKKLLVSPPDIPLEEAAIEVAYAKIAPEAKMMFDWAHQLHRQVYDVLADEKLSQEEKDATIARLIGYYKTRPDLAFSSSPKNMDLMEGQPYSLAFRNKYPKFNGLIWGYHWLQVGLYEPLMTGKTLEERQAGVTAAVARFRQMLENAPEHMPRIMPMTAAVAPTFAKRYPEAAIIFDNLHSMHDVVSDILANPKVPHDRKRAEILRAAAAYRDRTSYVITTAQWMEMAQMMGVENMGGPAVGFLPGWPTPTIARGQSAAEAMKNMAGMKMESMNHANMNMDQSAMMQMHMRMMDDPVIHERVMRDTTMRRLMNEMMQSVPADHEMNTSDTTSMTKASTTNKAKSPTAKRTSSAGKKAAAKPAPKPAMPAMDHSKMKMPGMEMPPRQEKLMQERARLPDLRR